MCRDAVKGGKLHRAPHIEMLEEAEPRSGFFEREQFEALYAELPEFLTLPFAIGFHTAMRRAEILGLEWGDVDFLANEIHLSAERTKNKTSRTVPITAQLRALLEAQFAKREGPLVCFRRAKGGNVRRIGDFRRHGPRRSSVWGYRSFCFTT